MPKVEPGYTVAHVGNASDIHEPCQWADWIYHLGGMFGRLVCEGAPEEAMRSNVLGVFNVARYGKPMIHVSTSEVYGPIDYMPEVADPQPNNWYGLTRRIGEMAVMYWNPNACIIRPFMLYGEGEIPGDHRSAMVRFVRDIAHGNEFELHADTSRSWLHKDDFVAFLGSLCGREGLPDIVNVGSEDQRTMLELVDLIAKALGKEPQYRVVPLPEKMTAHKVPKLSRSKALGFVETISLKEGVRRVCDAYVGESEGA